MHQKNRTILGCHVSIAGGLEKAIEQAKNLDCSCFQIFTKSNRQWHASDLTATKIALFKEKLQATYGIKTVVAHASYLINIGSGDESLNYKSAKSLEQELQRCQALEIPYLVMHPGNAVNIDKNSSKKLIIENLSTILNNNPGKTILVLENTAGQGSSIGNLFEDLKDIRAGIETRERIGFCIDTCHAFAAGYDLRTDKDYQKLLSLLDGLLGLENIKVLHLNDSKGNLGSNLDRHANIGEGKIGLGLFDRIINDEKFSNIPKILETPKEIVHGLSSDIYNMNLLRSLIR